MSTLTLRIPDELKAQLEALSLQQQRPASELVRESLRQYVAAEQPKALRGMTAPLAEAQSFVTDDDVFQAVS